MPSRRLTEPEVLGVRLSECTLYRLSVRKGNLGFISFLALVACASTAAPGRLPSPPVERPSKLPGVIDVPAGTCPSNAKCETFLDTLARQLRAHDGEIRSCYTRYGLSVDSELEVRAFVEVRTDAQQRVLTAQSVNGTSVELCLAEVMVSWIMGTPAAAARHFMMRVPLSKDDLGAGGGDVSPLTPEGVAATVRGRFPRIKNCYERALKRRPELKGRIVLEWTINRGGHVSLSNVAEDTLRDDETTTCVLHRVLEMTFDAPLEPVDISFPFIFTTAESS